MNRRRSKRRGFRRAVGYRLPLLGCCVFLSVFALSAFPAQAGRYGINYTRNLSYGLRDGVDYYFILDYRVWQRRGHRVLVHNRDFETPGKHARRVHSQYGDA